MQAWITEPIFVPMPLLALLIVLNMSFWSMLTIFIQWVVGRYRGKCTCGFVKFVFGPDGVIRKSGVVLGLLFSILRFEVRNFYFTYRIAFLRFRLRRLERLNGAVLCVTGQDVLCGERPSDRRDVGDRGNEHGIVGISRDQWSSNDECLCIG